MSALDTALARVDTFAANPDVAVAWHLDRAGTLARLRALLRRPELSNQRSLNACGPAAFFRVWFARGLVSAADFSCNLLRNGSAAIGSLVVAASTKLRSQDYPALRAATDGAHPHATPETADWMRLSALRDSENIFFDYLGEPFTAGDSVAGIPLPSTLAGWLSATGLYSTYSTVENDTTLVFSGDQQKFRQLIPTSNADVVLMVNAAAIYDLTQPPFIGPPPGGGGFSVPNDYIVMTGPLYSATTTPGSASIRGVGASRTADGREATASSATISGSSLDDWRRPGLLTCRTTGAMLCPRGDTVHTHTAVTVLAESSPVGRSSDSCVGYYDMGRRQRSDDAVIGARPHPGATARSNAGPTSARAAGVS
jgi:hypothetical protein